MVDRLVKSQLGAPRWLWKKFDIRPEGSALGVQGAVFLTVDRLYMWYVEPLLKTCNAGDQTFYDAIMVENLVFFLKKGRLLTSDKSTICQLHEKTLIPGEIDEGQQAT